MHQIIAYDSPTDTTGHMIFDPRINRYISDGKLNLKETDFDDLTLTVNQMNYLFGNVKPFQTHVEVYQDETLLFRGRAIDVTRQMKDNGQFIQGFSFAHIQSYLKDTSQRWAKINNMTIKTFFQQLIDTHNSQVPDYKKFVVRNVDVTNSTDNAYYYIEDGATTWDTIKDKLVSRLGGFIRVEYVDGVNYIDYLQNPGNDHPNDTPIQIAKNLQSASVQVDPTEVITQLVPLGATIEQDEENPDPDQNVSQPRIDISSANGWKDYIDVPDLQKEFGIIHKSVIWEDVHDPVILVRKAKEWITKQNTAKESWTVEAVEIPEERFETFKVSDRYLFVNKNVAEPQMLRVSQKSIDFAHPNKSALTIADKQVPLSQYQLENRTAATEVERLRGKVAGYDKKIVALKAEAKTMNETIKKQQTALDNATGSVYPWQGKSITAIGDSITYGYIETDDGNSTAPWTLQLIPICKFGTVTNNGVSASTIAKYSGEVATSFVERVDTIQDQNFVVMLGGVNDFGFDVPLGKFMDTSQETFFGALNYMAKQLVKNNPNARILWCTPVINTSLDHHTYDDNGELVVNDVGSTELDYVNAVKKVANYYGFPVLDLFANCIVNPLSRPEMFRDGTHQNRQGYVLLGQQISKFINTL